MTVATTEGLCRAIDASAATISALKAQAGAIREACERVVTALREGGRVLTAGNGGSAAESLHMAEELSGRYRGDRVALAGLSLVADATALTCIGNDYGYDHVFSRQVEAHGRAGDVLVLFSTSGSAENLRLALEAARARDMRVVTFLGRDGGALAGQGDVEVIVAGTDTERIQEAHQVLLHLVLDAVEAAFSPEERA